MRKFRTAIPRSVISNVRRNNYLSSYLVDRDPPGNHGPRPTCTASGIAGDTRRALRHPELGNITQRVHADEGSVGRQWAISGGRGHGQTEITAIPSGRVCRRYPVVVSARSPNLCSEWVPRLVCGGAGFDFERCPAFIGEFGLVLGTAARVGVDVEHGPSDGLLVGGSVLPYAFGLWFATATGRSESPVCLRTLSIKQKFDLILTYTCCIEFESAIRLLSTKSILGSCTMDDNGVRETLDSLLAADPDVMDRDQLAGFVSQLGRVRGWCAAAEVRVSRRTRQLAAEGRSESAAALLSDNGRCSS